MSNIYEAEACQEICKFFIRTKYSITCYESYIPH